VSTARYSRSVTTSYRSRDHAEVVCLADRLAAVQAAGRPVWLERRNGAEIALKGMLAGAGIVTSLDATPPDGAEPILASDADRSACRSPCSRPFNFSLRTLHQRLSRISPPSTSRRRTGTSRAPSWWRRAVRVRRLIVEEHHTLVRPPAASPLARGTHTSSRTLTSPALRRSRRCGRAFATSAAMTCSSRTTATTSTFPSCVGWRRPSCARTTRSPRASSAFGQRQAAGSRAPLRHRAGHVHRALDDTRTLARVCLALHELKWPWRVRQPS